MIIRDDPCSTHDTHTHTPLNAHGPSQRPSREEGAAPLIASNSHVQPKARIRASLSAWATNKQHVQPTSYRSVQRNRPVATLHHRERHCSFMLPARIGILRSSPKRLRPSWPGVEPWQRKAQPPGNCTSCCNTSRVSRCRSCCTKVSFVRASAGNRPPTCSTGTHISGASPYSRSVPVPRRPRCVPGRPPTRQPAAPSGNHEGAQL